MPNFVTSNAAIAAMYARVVLGFLSDVFGPKYSERLSSRPSTVSSAANAAGGSHPRVYIVELGAGAGKFSFLLLQQLWELRAFWPRANTAADDATDDDNDEESDEEVAARCPFIYVMTDVTRSNLDFWSAHPSFAPFVARGMLDFALLDAENSADGIHLERANFTLDRHTNANPICVIANYVLDTLKHDAFRMVHSTTTTTTTTPAADSSSTSTPPATAADSSSSSTPSSTSSTCLQLQEALISVSSPNSYEPDLSDPSLIRRFRHTWTYRDVPGAFVPLGRSETDPTPATAASAASTTTTAATTTSDDLPPLPPVPEAFQYYSGKDADLNRVLWELQQELAASFSVAAPSPAAIPGASHGSSSPSSSASSLATSAASAASAASGYSVLVPIGGLRCLRGFLEVSRHQLLFLCGDKAYNSVGELSGLRDPHIAIHGSFSLMVNLDFVRRFVEAQRGPATRGGAAIHTPYLDGFKVSAFACMEWAKGSRQIKQSKRKARASAPPASASSSSSAMAPFAAAAVSPTASPSASHFVRMLPGAGLAFQALMQFGPEHFSTLQRCVKDEVASPSLRHMLSVLRLSQADPDLFFKFRQQLIEQVSSTGSGGAWGGEGPPPSDKLLRDLTYDLARVGASYFPLSLPPSSVSSSSSSTAFSFRSSSSSSAASSSSSRDVFFELGRLAMSLREYGRAVECFTRSTALCGAHHVTLYNLGLSLYYSSSSSSSSSSSAGGSGGGGNERLEQALASFEASVAMRPDYNEAREWAQRTRGKIAAMQMQPQQQQQQQHSQLQAQPPYSPPQQAQPQQPSFSTSSSSSQPSPAVAAAPSFAAPAAADLPPSRSSFHGQLPFPSISASAAPAMPAGAPTATAATNGFTPGSPATPQFYAHTGTSQWL